MKKRYGLLSLIGALALISSVASAALSDYDYAMSVGISNETGSALADTPIAVQMQPLNLVNNGFLQADGEDWLPATVAGATLQGVAQGMTSNNVTWWVDISTQGDGATDVYDFHMGDSTATRDQRFRVSGGDDITATDHPDMDATNNLSVSVETELRTIPAGETMLAQKSGSYELGVRNSNEVFGRVYLPSAPTETLTVDANGDNVGTDFTSETGGCAAGTHYICIATDDSDWLIATTGAATEEEAFTLTAHALSGTISQVDILVVCQASVATLKVAGRLSSTTGAYSTVATSSDACTNALDVARPGGGSWTTADLDSLQVVVQAVESAPNSSTWDYVAVRVVYASSYEVSYSPIVVDTPYVFALTYDVITTTPLQLVVDGTAQDTDSTVYSINNSSNSLVVGSSIDGYLDAVAVQSRERTTTPLAEWPLCGYPLDTVGSYNGTLVSDVSFTRDTACYASFVGAGDYIDVGDITEMDGAVNASFALQFRSTDMSHINSPFSRWPSGGPYQILLRANVNGSIETIIRNDATGLYPGGTSTTGLVVANTWYSVVIVFDGAGATDADKLKIYLDGTEVALSFVSAPMPAVMSAASAGYRLGDEAGGANTLEGDLRDVVIWLSSLSAAEALEYHNATVATVIQYDFEPDDLEETQQGNSGNSWTWLGTAEDMSTGGTDHDGTYTLVRDLTGLTAWTYYLHNKNITTSLAAANPSDLLGVGIPDPDATQPTVNFLFRDILTLSLDHADFGTTALAAWFIFFSVVGVVLTLLVWGGTRSTFFSILPLPAVYWIGFGFGVGIPLWMPLLMTLVALGTVTGVKKMVQD